MPEKMDRTNRETWIGFVGVKGQPLTWSKSTCNLVDQVEINLVDQPKTGPLGRPNLAQRGPRAKSGLRRAKIGPNWPKRSQSWWEGRLRLSRPCPPLLKPLHVALLSSVRPCRKITDRQKRYRQKQRENRQKIREKERSENRKKERRVSLFG